MAKRAVRLLGILLLCLLLLISGCAAVLWYQGKDWLTSLARTELAKSGITLNSLAWRLEPQGITLENINLDIEDSRLQLSGLRITFDKPLTELTRKLIADYVNGELSLPLPQSIALEHSYVFLGSRSLMAAGSHQADNRAAMALDLNNLPHIALGSVEIDTQQGKLLRLEYLSLSEDRKLFSRIANPDGHHIVNFNANLGQDSWQTELGLSLPAAHGLVKQLAGTALPIPPDNPLFGFLHQVRLLESRFAPVITGELTIQSSLTLKTAALSSELSLKQAGLTLDALTQIHLSLSDVNIKADQNAGKTRVHISPVRLETNLSQPQRRTLLENLARESANSTSDSLVNADKSASTDPAQAGISWLSRLDSVLLEAHPLSLIFAMPQGMTLASDEPVSTQFMADARAGAWQLALSAQPELSGDLDAPFSHIQSPMELKLAYNNDLDLSTLLTALGITPDTGKHTSISLGQPQVALGVLISSIASPLPDATSKKASAALTNIPTDSGGATPMGVNSLADSNGIFIQVNDLKADMDLAAITSENDDQISQLQLGKSVLSLNKSNNSHLIARYYPATPSGLGAFTMALKTNNAQPPNAAFELRLQDVSINQKAATQVSSNPPQNKLDITEILLSSELRKPLELSVPLGEPISQKNHDNTETPLFGQLLAAKPEISSSLRLSDIRAQRQTSRNAGGKRLKSTRFHIDSVELNQQLNARAGKVQSQEQWQIGQYQPIRLSSQHQLILTADNLQTISANWQGQNSLGNWRQALAGSLNLSSDIPLAGDTHLNAEIELDLIKQTTNIQLETGFTELEGSVGSYPFHGGNLNANCALFQDKRRDNDFRLGCDMLSWSLANFQPGIIISDLSGQGTLALQSGEDGTLSEFDIDLTSKGKLLEGEFLLPQFKLNLKQPSHAYLILTGLSLKELLSLQPVEGIKADGIFDGVLPMDMRNGKVSVSGGRLAARAPGGLIEVANNPAVDELVASQPHLALVFDALKHLEYSSLAGSFDMFDSGDATINVEVKGKSRGIERPIHLNYSHEENLLQLIRSLTISEKLQSHIEQSVN